MGEEMGRAGGVSTDWNDREDEGEHRCRVEEKDKSSWRVYAGGDQDNRIDGRGWQYVVGDMGYPEVLGLITLVICINTLFSLTSCLTLISSSS